MTSPRPPLLGCQAATPAEIWHCVILAITATYFMALFAGEGMAVVARGRALSKSDHEQVRQRLSLFLSEASGALLRWGVRVEA